jgi:hypothetical protein
MPSGIDITAPQDGFPSRASGVEYGGKIKKALVPPGDWCPNRRHFGPFLRNEKKM